MRLPDNITPEGRAALVVCLRVFAEMGADEIEEEEKSKSAGMLGSDTADLAESNGTSLLPKDNTDAKAF